ncbi:MAG: 50S ribosomal protein L29 [Humidesulfovibrio sp.]|jgi:large subunit ribosomal protein L29|uniref:50S ribosomal protein L29 n=1 Tax=Humidesulfovibrio sp. TaxID=2910988 RepID=UPI0027EEA99B|nr:50S ribosomal protein L29 [Humidesulfovibrio sp.]MDQ7833957.1 50S ribosomal protein L29 [Humidesulfovibrio sp.]
MDAKELRALDAAELSNKLADLRKELFNLRFQHATAQLENTQRIPAVKKVIARILTIQTQRAMGA